MPFTLFCFSFPFPSQPLTHTQTHSTPLHALHHVDKQSTQEAYKQWRATNHCRYPQHAGVKGGVCPHILSSCCRTLTHTHAFTHILTLKHRAFTLNLSPSRPLTTPITTPPISIVLQCASTHTHTRTHTHTHTHTHTATSRTDFHTTPPSVSFSGTCLRIPFSMRHPQLTHWLFFYI